MRTARAMVVVGILGGLGCASSRGPQPAVVVPPQTVAAAPATVDCALSPATCATPLRGLTHETLHASLWMQTAAEYGVLSSTTYRAATSALTRALADKTWTAALEQTGPATDKPPAVIVDVDETVLDNSPMQIQLALEGTDYCTPTWRAWVAQAAARPIPGALEFARDAAARGVRILYVTNRTAEEKADTVRNLRCARKDADGLCAAFPVEEGDVYAVGDRPGDGAEAWTSDKTKRRAYLAERFRILLLVGDDLRDFVSVPSLTRPEGRVEIAQRYADRWGERWFLLPNAMYGSWDRSLYPPELKDDRAILQAKRLAGRAFREPYPHADACRAN
jgi:5'-nucleotidase (lipoprotein e(P4) family)